MRILFSASQSVANWYNAVQDVALRQLGKGPGLLRKPLEQGELPQSNSLDDEEREAAVERERQRRADDE